MLVRIKCNHCKRVLLSITVDADDEGLDVDAGPSSAHTCQETVLSGAAFMIEFNPPDPTPRVAAA